MKKSILIAILAIFCVFGLETSIVVEAEESENIVIFDPDDGTSYSSWFQTPVEYGGLITEIPPNPEKEGYRFLGWYRALEEDGTPIYWNFSEDRVTNNTTLWAAYAQTHQVTFDPDNDTTYDSWFKVQVEDGGLITEIPPIPEKEGYKFLGWYKALDDEGTPIYWNFSEDRVTDNTTLWAAYRQTHIVTFNPEDGTSYTSWFHTQVEDGGLITETPPVPEKEGYKFLGWYKALDDEGTPIYWNFSNDTVMDNTMLWAAYAREYLVTFNPKNDTPENEWTRLTVTSGSKISEVIPVPKKAGYTFVGWSKVDNETALWNFNLDEVNEDRTLYAIWEKEDEAGTGGSKKPLEPTQNEKEGEMKEGISSNNNEANKQVSKKLPKMGASNSSLYFSLIGFFMIVGSYIYRRTRSKA